MFILAREKAHAWLKDYSFGMDTKEVPILDLQDRLLFSVPADSSNLLPLAHRLAKWLEYGQSLLWMSHWAPREPEEMEAFLQIRKRYHFYEDLKEAPAFLFENSPEDRIVLGEVIFYLLLLNWEGYLFRDEPKAILWFADEIVDIRGLTQKEEDELIELFPYMGFSFIDE